MSRKASGKPKVTIVKRKQKNGDTYVYEVTSLYNPEKRYNEHVSSKLIGKISASGGEIIPTRHRKASKAENTESPKETLEPEAPETETSKEESPKLEAIRNTVGVTDILDWIGRESGIDQDLENSTDEGTAGKITSIARFWMANPDETVRRIEEWQIDHKLPYKEGISEDVCYTTMQEIGHDASISQNYFRQRANRASSKASLAVDSTTVCSYSEHLNDVRFGYNKDGNGLATVKLLTLYDTVDHQPVAYARQPGNIPDATSVLNTLKQLSVLGMKKPLLVLDGGFFSERNILLFLKSHCKFLMRGQVDGKWIFPQLEAMYGSIEMPSNAYPDDPDIYGRTVMIDHTFTLERQRTRNGIEKGTNVSEEHRLYLHIYYDTNKARLEKAVLIKEIRQVQEQLLEGVSEDLLSAPERELMKKYMTVKRRGETLSVTLNDDAILKENKYYGYFVLISNESMSAFDALKEYRLREKTEEAFRLDKQSNDSHVTRTKTSASLEGRFFCQFVALGYESFFMNRLSKLKKSLAVPNGDPKHDRSPIFQKEKQLLKWLNKMSMAKLFDWFDAIQETTVSTAFGKARWRTETIERDRLFLQKLGVIK